jgi:hypothetical protein
VDSLDALLGACAPWQREVAERFFAGETFALHDGRAQRSGKRYATWLAISLAVARGESVHVVAPGGTTCAGEHAGCSLPRWDAET